MLIMQYDVALSDGRKLGRFPRAQEAVTRMAGAMFDNAGQALRDHKGTPVTGLLTTLVAERDADDPAVKDCLRAGPGAEVGIRGREQYLAGQNGLELVTKGRVL
jgi:nucleoside phosphorylase